MRTFLRTLAATAALGALVLGGGVSTTLAASDQASAAHTDRYVFHDEWCFDGGIDVDCSVADGTVSSTTTPSGRDVARIHYKLATTTFGRDGVQIGTSSEFALERWIAVENGKSSVFVIERHRSSNDGGDCAYGYKLQMVDFELKMERFTGPGCS